MKKSDSIISALAIYLTQVVSLSNLYMFISALESDTQGYIEVLPWLLFSLMTFGVVYVFLKAERTIPQVICLGVICFVITVVAMSLFFVQVTGIVPWLMAWLFLGGTTALACTANLGEVNPNTVVMCCECPAIGIGLLLFMDQSDVFHFPIYDIVLTIGVLLFAILALTRTKMDGKSAVQDGKGGIALATTSFCFVFMGALAVGFVRFASRGASEAVSKSADFLSEIITGIFSAIQRFVIWLLSLLPVPETQELDIPPPQSISISGQEEAVMEADLSYLGIVALVLLILLIIGIIIWMVFFFKNKKIVGSVQKTRYKRPQKPVEKTYIWKKLFGFIRKKWEAMLLTIVIFRKRNTPKGAALWLVRMAEKRGVKKEVSESYYGYLMRLQMVCTAIDPEVADYFITLANIVNVTFYAPYEAREGLGKREYQKMRLAVRKIKKPMKISQ